MNIGEQGSLGPAVSPWEMVQQNFRQQFRVDSAMALDQELSNRFRESLAALSARGQNFNVIVGNPYLYREFAQYTQDGVVPTRRNPRIRMEGDVPLTDFEEGPPDGFEEMRRANEAIRQLNDPRIKSFEQILAEVSEMQRGVEEETASMSERASTLGNILGFAGTIGGSFTLRDPLNIITAPIGIGRTVATRIAGDMALAGGTTAVTEFTDVGPNRAIAGLPERDPLLDIAAATIGAGLIRGGIEGVGAGYRALRGRLTPEIDFDLRDAQLQQMFADNSQSPSARGAASLLEDTRFIERNNPFGEGYAAQERFIAELRAVQRSMNGEPMTAVARVLPPVPFESIRKAADFEIVREQSPEIYARMEQAQAQLAKNNAPIRLEEGLSFTENERRLSYRSANNEQVDIFLRFDEDGTTHVEINPNDVESPVTLGVGEVRRVQAAIQEMYPQITKFVGERISGARIGRTQEVAARRTATQEYEVAYRAVEAEGARLREQQARAEAAQQNEASNILARVNEGRPFIGPLLRYDSVETLVNRINTINDALDERAIAAFTRQSEEVPSAWLTEDGRVDIGLREPVDPDFRIPIDDGEMSVIDIMRDLQDDADLVDAVRICSI